MNTRHLGDCFDFYKRWFLQHILQLDELPALPMLTEPWGEDHNRVYQELLAVRVVNTEVLPNGRERGSYFQPANSPEFLDKDLFVDPDTGFRFSRQLPRRKSTRDYLFADELEVLLTAGNPDRLVIIYDQSIIRGGELDSAASKIRALKREGFHALAYRAQAAMLCVSRSRDRIHDLECRLREQTHIPQYRLKSSLDSSP